MVGTCPNGHEVHTVGPRGRVRMKSPCPECGRNVQLHRVPLADRTPAGAPVVTPEQPTTHATSPAPAGVRRVTRYKDDAERPGFDNPEDRGRAARKRSPRVDDDAPPAGSARPGPDASAGDGGTGSVEPAPPSDDDARRGTRRAARPRRRSRERTAGAARAADAEQPRPLYPGTPF